MICIRMNVAMQQYNTQIEEASRKEKYLLPRPLQSLLDYGIQEQDGLIILGYFAHLVPTIDRKALFDATGCEAFLNHVHIADYLSDVTPKDSSKIINYGIVYSFTLAQRLESAFPGKEFEIVMAIERDKECNCSSRFYCKRDGETYLHADLEAYLEEAILVLDVGTRRGD